MDLPSLKAALPKYATSGLGPITMQWWTAFIEMLEANMVAEEESSQAWLLTELLELKKAAQPRTVETTLIPEQLSQMRGSETATIPEVWDMTPRQCNS